MKKYTCHHCNYTTDKNANLTRHFNRWPACMTSRYKEILVDNKKLIKKIARSDKKHVKALELKNKTLEKMTKKFSKALDRKDKEIARLQKKLERKDRKIATLIEDARKPTHVTNNYNNLIQINLDANFFQERIEDYTRNDYMDAVKGAVRFAVSALNDGDGKRYICADPARHIFKYLDKDGRVNTDAGGIQVWDAMKGPVTSKAKKTRDDLLSKHPESLYYNAFNEPLTKLQSEGNAPPRGFSAELARNTMGWLVKLEF